MMLLKRKNSARLIKCQEGFSFIELAIGMTLLGLFVAASLQTYKIYSAGRVLRETEAHRDTIEIALEKFFIRAGRYPCPADPSLPATHADAGKSNCGGSLSLGNCTSGSKGLCLKEGARDTDADADADPDPILIGSLPYVDLGIAPNITYDGWKSRLGYAVTKSQTIKYNLATAPEGFKQTRGAIEFQDPNGGPAFNIGLKEHHLIVWSLGSDKRGAYSPDGIMAKPCGTVERDRENCDNDSVFLAPDDQDTNDHIRALREGASFYDDYMLIYQIDTDSDFWTTTPGMEVVNKGGIGKVGINVSVPTEMLEVGGNIRAKEDSRTDKFCNQDGIDCFEAKIISGEGISCDGESMNGIEKNGPSCAFHIKPGTINVSTCPAGELATGITPGGDLICATVPTTP